MNKEKRNLNKGKRIGKWEIFGFLTGFVGIVLSIALLCLWEYAEHENRHVILPFGKFDTKSGSNVDQTNTGIDALN